MPDPDRRVAVDRRRVLAKGLAAGLAAGLASALGVAGLLAPRRATAHPADEGGLQISILSTGYAPGADPTAERFDVEIAIYLRNVSGQAVTLRGVISDAAATVRILQTVRLLGIERETAFVRIDPGESLILEPPQGRLLARDVAREKLAQNGFFLQFDFGPDGTVGALARLPAASPEDQ